MALAGDRSCREVLSCEVASGLRRESLPTKVPCPYRLLPGLSKENAPPVVSHPLLDVEAPPSILVWCLLLYPSLSRDPECTSCDSFRAVVFGIFTPASCNRRDLVSGACARTAHARTHNAGSIQIQARGAAAATPDTPHTCAVANWGWVAAWERPTTEDNELTSAQLGTTEPGNWSRARYGRAQPGGDQAEAVRPV